MNRVWLGVDIGTQGVRVAAHTTDGTLVAEARAERPPRTPARGAMVHDPELDWWGGSCEALRTVAARVPVDSIAGIGLAGLFPAVCLIDGDGAALGEAILYGDSRAAEEVAMVGELLGSTLTGDEVAPRLVWLRRHAAGRFRRARLAIGPAGYVALRLTGVASLDPHSAVRWGGIANTARDGWDVEAVERIGLSVDLLPPLRRPHDVVGYVTSAAARLTGLPSGVAVVTGATDTFAQLLGDGVSRAGDAMIYYGSSGTLLLCTADMEAAAVTPSAFAPESPYRLAAYALNSGSFLEQARSEIFGGTPYRELDAAAASRLPGADGLFVVPHVSGRLMPHSEPEARAAIVGLQLHHERSHLWRALLESFGYVLIEARRALDREVTSVMAAGGGAASRIWRQIISDMTGWRQDVAPPGGSARGAAFLAAYGLGEVTTFADVHDRWLAGQPAADQARPTEPDPSAAARYQDLFEQWRRIDRDLAGLLRPGATGPADGELAAAHRAADGELDEPAVAQAAIGRDR
jgi:xylulokinase